MTKKSSRKVFRKLRFPVLIICILLIGFGIIGYRRIHQPLPNIQPHTSGLNYADGTSIKLAWPATGQAAIGATDYGVLSTSGSQTPVPTASIAKLITALAVLKVRPIAINAQGPMITLTQNDVNLYNAYSSEGGSVAPVTAGEQISEYQLMEGMLLPSANNMADSLAIWAFGSLPSYDTYANHMVADMGLTNTHVGTDASGFLPSTTSTASDLVSLGIKAETNSVIASIVSQHTATIPVAGTITNVNWLVGSYGINGLKTGNSNQDKGAYLFSASYQLTTNQKITIIGAVMDGDTLQKAMDDGAALLLSAQKAFSYSSTVQTSQTIGYYKLPWGGTIDAVAANAVGSVAWQGIPLDHPGISLSAISASQEAGSTVGAIRYTQGENVISSSPIILKSSVTTPSKVWRIFHT